MAATLSVRPNRFTAGSLYPRSPYRRRGPDHAGRPIRNELWRGLTTPSITLSRRKLVQAGSRADDSAPSDMSVENALKLLGVTEGASFDDILRAKNSILASCKDDQEAIAQAEAAYDMLLMQSLTQRRKGRVVSSNIRYADVKPVNAPGMGSMPQWLQATMKNAPVSVETPSTGELGIQAGVYGALMVLTYVNGTSTSPTVPYGGADVPGLILAGSFGASLYFMTKKNVKLGKATVITLGGLVAGAVVGSVVENWLQVDIVPFLGIHSPAAVVSEFILFSQFLVSLYLR
ncbi:protein CHAPERONE-LIKE PROTEIN OF POR1, chloroplastic [Corylus avellana]|uniref:protein CHAPERONE-LIKE PROTEIN OF POR1, chloroplastic n=1 Tax=Corylus avellana TaxID=13451 RepID=UPI00286C1998|nr:protein CHAPERONE-LIKE PROTEIN OF POR1, chloroplastic [Corylus avellana]